MILMQIVDVVEDLMKRSAALIVRGKAYEKGLEQAGSAQEIR